MAKLSNEKIVEIIEGKNYTAVDLSQYKNIQSEIVVRCPNGHEVITNLARFRGDNFFCPGCENLQQSFVNPKVPPKKGNFRIVAFDQATERMGVSIWDDGELSYYSMILFTGDTIERLVKIKQFLENTVVENWKPDYMIFEDIQQQNGNVVTYKVLAGLLSLCCVIARENKIDYDAVLPSVWRSKLGLNKRGSRAEEKKLSLDAVEDWFGIRVGEDSAEAILIGKYASMNKKKRAF